MRAGWNSKAQQRQVESAASAVNRLERVGRMLPVPITNFSALSDLKTRGAQISFLVTSLEGLASLVLLRNFSRDPGSAKAIHNWPVESLRSTPQTFPVALHFADADQDIAGKIAYYWIRVLPASKRTIGNIFLSGPQKFDASLFPSAKQITGDFAVSQAYTPTTQPVTAATGGSANHATVSVASFVVQYPFGPVTYSSGTITPLLDATIYYIYCDDPTYKGGAQTYIASTLNPDVTAALHRLYVGKVTTPVFGGGGTFGGGGGGGACFSGNTLVRTERGQLLISEIKRGDVVFTLRQPGRVKRLLVHEYDGVMHQMGFGELVTPGHRMHVSKVWRRAEELFPQTRPFKGRVYNLELVSRSKSDESHCYTLGNGWVAHNALKA